MSWTVNNLIGFETRDSIEAAATGGTPTYNTSIKYGNGKASVSMNAGADTYDVAQFQGTGGQGGNTPFAVQFHFRTADRSVSGNFLHCLNDDDQLIWDIQVLGGGDVGKIRVTDQSSTTYDTASAVTTDDTWHAIQIFWGQNNSGNFDLHVDGTSVISTTTFDGSIDGGFDRYRLGAPGSSTIYFDDFFCSSSVTGVADFFDDWEVLMYKGDTGATVVSGSTTLDSSTNWSDMWELPSNDTNYAYYDLVGAVAKAGGIDFDGGSTYDGPNTDASIDTIRAAKWIARMLRENGGATVHHQRIGNSGDGLANKVVTLGTGFASFYYIVATPATGEIPEANEYASAGFGHDGTGGREIRLGEHYCSVLNEIPDAPTGFVPFPSPRGTKGGMNQIDGGVQ